MSALCLLSPLSFVLLTSLTAVVAVVVALGSRGARPTIVHVYDVSYCEFIRVEATLPPLFLLNSFWAKTHI